MKERQILFSGPMVRALLDGRKTQTRRVIKPQPDSVKNFGRAVPYRRASPPQDMANAKYEVPIVCPYGAPGDRLWVKETHAIVPRTAYAMSDGVQQTLKPGDDHDAAVYAAGWERSKPGRWRPSIHMPRWASRLTLEITEVRVERIQDISDRGQPNDCIAEGAFGEVSPLPRDWLDRGFSSVEKAWFHDLWNSINRVDSWDANPWVWAVSFEVINPAGGR